MLKFDWFKRFLSGERERIDTAEPQVFSRPISTASPFGTRLWAVGGGKGGVGKSLIASNAGIALSKQGKKVLLVDADLGAANLHTFLGVEGGRTALSSFLKDEVSDFKSLIQKTPFPNLDLVSGAKDALDVPEVKGSQIRRLRDALKKVEYDYAILDVGPGTSSNFLDMFLMSNEGIIVSTPEPTTIENNYRFLKCLFLRKIKTIADSQPDGVLKDLLQRIFSDKWSQRVKTVADITDQLIRLDFEQGRMLKEDLKSTSLSMIVNQTKRGEDAKIGKAIQNACSDYFGVDIDYIGSVGYEETVGESIRTRRPLSVYFTNSAAAKSIDGCLVRLLEKNRAAQQVTFQI
ncbi:MAG: AAA family ATPase [Deltaproteobacteria bacterium]|nr:AAA family ATPase [Deltaproteobacteria bacterium]MBZ0219142.1 AAA family ATPase [Deltaproteobacteria bacterium]